MDEKIEEMVLAVYPWLKEVPIEERKQLRENVSGLMVMERLYNAGYRKIPENAVVVTEKDREELNDLLRCAMQRAEKWEKLCGIKIKETRKETAEKFAERVKMAFYYEFDELIPSIMADKIDEILKEITEGEKEISNETV